MPEIRVGGRLGLAVVAEPGHLGRRALKSLGFRGCSKGFLKGFYKGYYRV